MQKILLYKSSEIVYYTFGNGSEVVFCFHGYGLDGSSFGILESAIGRTHTLICIDFPFHGATLWKDDIVFTQTDLINIIRILHPLPSNKFSVIGYSMGGRIALNLIQINADAIWSLFHYLASPSGISD